MEYETISRNNLLYNNIMALNYGLWCEWKVSLLLRLIWIFLYLFYCVWRWKSLLRCIAQNKCSLSETSKHSSSWVRRDNTVTSLIWIISMLLLNIHFLFDRTYSISGLVTRPRLTNNVSNTEMVQCHLAEPTSGSLATGPPELLWEGVRKFQNYGQLTCWYISDALIFHDF